MMVPPEAPTRHRLPDERPSLTRQVEIVHYKHDRAGQPTIRVVTDLYIRVGLYENGSPAEVFVSIGKGGSRMSTLMDALGTAISVGLQCGIPLETYTSKLKWQGDGQTYYTSDPAIPQCKSPLDYLAKWLEGRFLNRGVDEERILQ